MIRTYIYIITLSCLLFALPTRAEQAFFSAITDLPLMPGLTEVTENALIFDKAEGRIIESMAMLNDIPSEQVTQYYMGTLPQLGWHHSHGFAYSRANERLQFNFEDIGEQKLFKVLIAPR